MFLSRLLRSIQEDGGIYTPIEFIGGGSLEFYTKQDAEKKSLVKVMKIKVSALLSGGSDSAYDSVNTWGKHGPGFPYGVQSLASRVLMAIKGNLLMECQGGPRIRKVGSWNRSNETYLAIEMEQKFPNQKALLSKDIELENHGFPLLSDPASRRILARELASKFVSALEDGIIPNDAQLVISGEGQSSWVDGDEWIEIRSSTGAFDWSQFSSWVLMDFVTTFERNPPLGKEVFETLIDLIRRLPKGDQDARLHSLLNNLDHKVWIRSSAGTSDRIQVPFRDVLRTLGVDVQYIPALQTEGTNPQETP